MQSKHKMALRGQLIQLMCFNSSTVGQQKVDL